MTYNIGTNLPRHLLGGGTQVMTETKQIMSRIADVKVRLDRASVPHDPSLDARADHNSPRLPAASLEEKVQLGAWHNQLIDSAMRPLDSEQSTLPERLTIRGVRLVQRGRLLLRELRRLADDALLQGEAAPLSRLHTEASAMIDAVMRTVQAFPPSPGAQIRLCEGLDAILDDVAERLETVKACLEHQGEERTRLEQLAGMLRKASNGYSIRQRDLHALADTLIQEAQQGRPMRFTTTSASDPAIFAAAHCLTVARVMARLILDDKEFEGRHREAVMSALVHDVGMARLPASLLSDAGQWSDAQRREMERHTTEGAKIAARLELGTGWAVEAAQDHHERLDGTGYPAGKSAATLSPFVRLLAVCDVYAALCVDRPHRAAQETRTALTDTLLLADSGLLDKVEAEKLLKLSFYPVGSVVELTDGAVGVVTAVHAGEEGLTNPAKPIVMLLAGPDGGAIVCPGLLDLLGEESRGILRALPVGDRMRTLGKRYPDLV